MAKKTDEQLFAEAKAEFDNKNIIAFLGKAFYGKTVVSTLLKDALSNFVKKNPEKYAFRVIKGYDTVYNTFKRMIEGEFPSGTYPKEKPEVTIEITSKGILPGKMELILRDISGGVYDRLFHTEYQDMKDLIHTILTHDPVTTDSYGSYSYLIFAKLYVIMIDCSIFGTWPYEQTRLVQAINAILALKTYTTETVDGRIVNPIAIIMTKADTLDEKISKLSPDEMLKEHLPDVYSILNQFHKGERGFFMMSVTTEKLTPEELVAEMNKEKIMNERGKEEKLKLEIDKASAEAKKAAIAAGQPDQAEAAGKAAAEAKRVAILQQELTESSSTSQEDQPKERYKIKPPLSYSSREYARFITWMLKALSR